MSEQTEIARYSPEERGNHWLVVVCFILAACSGLAFFHPSLYFLSAVLGGGPWSRILHPFVGVAMCLFFVVLMVRSFGRLVRRRNGLPVVVISGRRYRRLPSRNVEAGISDI